MKLDPGIDLKLEILQLVGFIHDRAGLGAELPIPDRACFRPRQPHRAVIELLDPLAPDESQFRVEVF